jgi:hypothetical protein
MTEHSFLLPVVVFPWNAGYFLFDGFIPRDGDNYTGKMEMKFDVYQVFSEIRLPGALR